MIVKVTRPALPLETAPKPKTSVLQTFWFDGDSSETTFVLSAGWKPFLVYDNGALMRPGTSEDYTIEFNGHLYSVVFDIAPLNVDVAVVAERLV